MDLLDRSSEPGNGHGFEMNPGAGGMARAVLVGGAGAFSLARSLQRW